MTLIDQFFSKIRYDSFGSALAEPVRKEARPVRFSWFLLLSSFIGLRLRYHNHANHVPTQGRNRLEDFDATKFNPIVIFHGSWSFTGSLYEANAFKFVVKGV